jgi:hypothetical protein
MVERVDMVTLDCTVAEEVSILHLDLEGYEFEAIEGAAGILERWKPDVVLEIHRDALHYNRFMERYGYTPCKQLIDDAGFMVFVNTVYRHESRRSFDRSGAARSAIVQTKREPSQLESSRVTAVML